MTDKEIDPAMSRAYMLILELANEVHHELAKLEDSISEALARKMDA